MHLTQSQYRRISAFTERLLPHRNPQNTQEANENNQCAALAKFWEKNSKIKEAIIERTIAEIETDELREWREDFNRRYGIDASCQCP